MSVSNFAKFDSIESDDFLAAEQVLEDINDTNDIEFCLKSVFHIYLNSRISGVDYTSQDTILLDSIAELNAITTGPGVLIARILLNKEIYDYLSSGSRMGSPTKKVVTNPLDIHIYPNPSRNLLFVQPSFLSENFSITIADITGRTLLKKTNQFQIETSSLNSGSYFLVYEAKDHRVVKKFEIIK